MKDIAIDTNGNFIKENFGLTLTTDPVDYVVQKIRIKLRTFLKEYFLDVTIGLPYMQIQEKNPNIKLITALMKQQIMEVEGVSSILAFDARYDNSKRTFTPTFKVSTTTGETGGGSI
jgi:hypothetical protein